MSQVSIQPRVPEQGDRYLRHRDRKRKTMHSIAQVSCLPLGDTGDQIRPRASASAVAKLLTTVTIPRSSPNGLKASSIGPLSKPRRETLMCLAAAAFWGALKCEEASA